MRQDISQEASRPVPDAETIEFAQKVFDLVRAGDTQRLHPLLEQGLPTNLRNHKDHSLLMPASYHGHLDTARLLLDFGTDSALCNDQGQAPLAGAPYKGDAAMVSLLLEKGNGCGRRNAGRTNRPDDGGDAQPLRCGGSPAAQGFPGGSTRCRRPHRARRRAHYGPGG